MSNDGSNRVYSEKSLTVLVDGRRLEIKIYQLDGAPTWTLEIVDDRGSSHLWKSEFTSDSEALDLALVRLHEDGMAGLIGASSHPAQREHSEPTTSAAQG